MGVVSGGKTWHPFRATGSGFTRLPTLEYGAGDYPSVHCPGSIRWPAFAERGDGEIRVTPRASGEDPMMLLSFLPTFQRV